MKRTLTMIVLVIALFIVVGLLQGYENTYKIKAKVINSNTVICERGHIWKYDNTRAEGEEITLIMHTNTTDSYLLDDYIIEVK